MYQFVGFYARFYSINWNYKFQMQCFPRRICVSLGFFSNFNFFLLFFVWCILLVFQLLLCILSHAHSQQSEKFSSALLNFLMRSCSMHVQYDFIIFGCQCSCIGTQCHYPKRKCMYCVHSAVRQCLNAQQREICKYVGVRMYVVLSVM